MRPKSLTFLLVVLILISAVAAGCAHSNNRATAQIDPQVGTGTVVAPDCPIRPLNPPRTRLRLRDLKPRYVLRCEVFVRGTASGEVDTVITERARPDGVDLVNSLLQPAPSGSDRPCTPTLVVLRGMIIIFADGKAVAPYVPVNNCGETSAAFARTYDGLHFVAVPPSTTPRVSGG